MTARSAGAVVAFGYWQTQSGSPATAPGTGKYQADSWSAPTLLAISTTDADGHARNVAGVLPGDTIYEIASNDSQNYQSWTVNSIIDNGTWVQLGITVAESGSSFVAPGSNQSRLLEVIHPAPPPGVPPPAVGMPSLATPDDIVARLGRNLNQTEAARVDAMLKDGSAIIRRYAREDFLFVENDVLKINADAGIIVLPNRPVLSVDKLVAVSGYPQVPNLDVTWYKFDGIDTILVPEPWTSGIINLGWYWYETMWSRQPFQVTHTHGYIQTPPEVLGLLCDSIISELATPTMSATLQSESIGAYSYSMRRRAVGGGLYAALMDFGMTTVLMDYRQKSGTIATRF